MIVGLNVGGTVFLTDTETLTRTDCMLKLLAEGKYGNAKDDQGNIFIDRDATHFRHILNYLRDGRLVTPETSAAREELAIEAEFFCLFALAQQCREEIARSKVPTVRQQYERTAQVTKKYNPAL
jgi:hypothetical protein